MRKYEDKGIQEYYTIGKVANYLLSRAFELMPLSVFQPSYVNDYLKMGRMSGLSG